jgi:hypothetical protein
MARPTLSPNPAPHPIINRAQGNTAGPLHAPGSGSPGSSGPHSVTFSPELLPSGHQINAAGGGSVGTIPPPGTGRIQFVPVQSTTAGASTPVGAGVAPIPSSGRLQFAPVVKSSNTPPTTLTQGQQSAYTTTTYTLPYSTNAAPPTEPSVGSRLPVQSSPLPPLTTTTYAAPAAPTLPYSTNGSPTTYSAPSFQNPPLAPAQQRSYEVVPSNAIGTPAAVPTYASGGHAIIPTAPASTPTSTAPAAAATSTYFTTPSGAVVNAATGQLASPPPANWSTAPRKSSSPVNLLPPAVQRPISQSASSSPSSITSIPLSALPQTGLNPNNHFYSATGTSKAFPALGSSGIANSTPTVDSAQSQTSNIQSGPPPIVRGLVAAGQELATGYLPPPVRAPVSLTADGIQLLQAVRSGGVTRFEEQAFELGVVTAATAATSPLGGAAMAYILEQPAKSLPPLSPAPVATYTPPQLPWQLQPYIPNYPNFAPPPGPTTFGQ